MSVQGTNRPLVAGEFRSRRRIQPVERVAAVSESLDVSTSQRQDSHSKQSDRVPHYQSTNVPNEPSEVLFVREIVTAGVITASPTSSIADVALLCGEGRYGHSK